MLAVFQTSLRCLLKAATWLLFAAAGLLFFWGGRAIHEFLGVDRLVAEAEGLILSAVCGFLGMLSKSAGGN